jgi:hypothetical protein
MRKLRKARRDRPVNDLSATEPLRLPAPLLDAKQPFFDDLEKRLIWALENNDVPRRPNAGSLDGQNRVIETHVARVESPDAGRAVVADIEELDDDRAREILSQVDQLLRRTVNAQDGR